MTKTNSLIPTERIRQKILRFRECNVILDSDLAELYGVETRRLNEQVRRNAERFSEEFMFQLTAVPTLIEQLQLFMGVTIRNVTVTS